MLGDKQGKLLNTYIADYVLYDLETTGTSVNCDEVIEISAVKVRNGKVVEGKQTNRLFCHSTFWQVALMKRNKAWKI